MSENPYGSDDPGWGSERDDDTSSMPPPPSGEPMPPPSSQPPTYTPTYTPADQLPPAGAPPPGHGSAPSVPPPDYAPPPAYSPPPTYTPTYTPAGAPPPDQLNAPPPGAAPPPPPSDIPPSPGAPGGQPPMAAPPGEGGGMGTPVKVLLGVGALVVVLFIAAAVLVATLADDATVAAGSIERGECFADFSQFETDATGTGEVTSVDRIDCAEAHALEAYYVGPAYESYDLYPGVEEIDDVAITSCRQRFERFVDFEWESSELDFWWLTPTPAGWDQGDRELVCLVGDFDKEHVVGTLENAGR